MRQKLLNSLLFISEWCEKIHQKFSKKPLVDLDYSSLSPIDYGDKEGHYSNALEWAINNRRKEDIKNIALTGPYGAGKSTILKTFQKNNKGTDLKFLNISLATFKEEKIKKDNEGNPIEKEKNELLRLIETSILQQIFYHEEDKNIPDSRFKKIKSYSFNKLLLNSLGVLLFIIALLDYFHPKLIQGVFKDYTFSETILNTLHYSKFLIIFLGTLLLLFKSIRIISSITINKLKFQNAEIGISESVNKSILNHHLDEILYFFSVTPYNVVIIEDLDRFQETEIFTKLREINLLLNNSKKTKEKNIVFIYAVRDDMFSDNERIKFFDFIIPVIPVINSSNSSEILLSKKKRYKYDLSDTFIENISFYIDDMRLLHNITNEFYLYKQKQEGSPLNQDKLFAIITYKNIYPNDFVDLSKNKGDLFNIFSKKADYINSLISNIDEKIEEGKNKIEELNDLKIKNVSELRLIYIMRMLEKIEQFNKFIIKNNTITIDELLEDENFEYLKKDKALYQEKFYNASYRRYDTSNKNIDVKFSEIEKKVDPNKSYNEREKLINDFNTNKINFYRLKVKELENKKVKTRNSKISDLLNSDEIEKIEIPKKFNKGLVLDLLKNGYIDEDYIDYISLFHEGSITRNDYRFLISVRNKQKLDFDYKLSKTEKLVEKLNILDFNSEYILNYDLLNFLLKTSNKENQLDFIFSKLKDESNISIQFIDGFLDRTENLSAFINKLSFYWAGIWNHYLNDASYSDEFLNKILKYILEYGELSSIKKIDEVSDLKNHLNKDSTFLNIITNTKKIKNVIKALKLKFIDLDFEGSPKDLLGFVYENNYYQINKNIISKFIKEYGVFDQISFDNTNYHSIKNSKAESLISYLDENIDTYVEKIYLEIKTNVNEEQNDFLELINNKKINLKNRKDIIGKVETKVTELQKIDAIELISLIVDENKSEAKWSNLLFFFNELEEKIVDTAIKFINIQDNSEKLSKIKIPTEVEGENKYGTFVKTLIYRNDINNQCYDLITKSFPWWYSDIKFENLDEEKVYILIKNNVVSPTIKSFDKLKESFDDFNIKLLEKHKTKFIELIDELDLDNIDINLILKSEKLKDFEKIKLLDITSNEVISSNPENLKLIAFKLLEIEDFNIGEELIKDVLLSKSVPIESRVRIFNKRFVAYDYTFIEEFLGSLNYKYEKITNKNRRAKIEDNSDNIELLKLLEEESYISSFSKGLFGLRVNHKRLK